jgi:alpha-ketoglutarate-dependent taurine dioxygenase
MFFGDDAELTESQLQELDEVTNNNIKYVKMRQGDVVLLDNYKTLHGRNVFDGTRKHGVCWFEGWEGEEEMKQQANQQVMQLNA